MLNPYRRKERGGAYRLSSIQAFQSTLPLQQYFKRQQNNFDSNFQYIHDFTKMESLNSQLSDWQKGKVGTFIGLSSNPSKSDTFRVRLQNRKRFNVQYVQQDFEHFIISKLVAETSFTGITEVNTTAEATIPFFDICRKYDSSSRLAQ